MRVDFTDLNLFRHIVEAGSITHGAERANLALAAASTRIRKMELAFGAELLVRGRRRHADAGAPTLLLMRAPSSRNRRDEGGSQPLTRAGLPDKCVSCPTPMRSPNFCRRR